MRTYTKHQGRDFRVLAATLLLALLACGAEEPPAKAVGIDLRPVWTHGQVIEIREEKTERGGVGRFPAAGEIEARSETVETRLDVYREEVLEALESELFRTRRTYRTATWTRNGKKESLPVEGKTYEIAMPLGGPTFLVEEVTADGSRKPVTEAETRHVGSTAIRMAATLLPADPVPVGATWRPGRDESAISRLGSGPYRMNSKLVGVERSEDRRTANVTGEADVDIQTGPQAGTRLALRETLLVDLTNARLGAYRMVSERRLATSPTRRRELWHQGVTDVTFTYPEK